jgi:Arc/MetJ-type ribon-helix-helix transcriptional regulator
VSNVSLLHDPDDPLDQRAKFRSALPDFISEDPDDPAVAWSLASFQKYAETNFYFRASDSVSKQSVTKNVRLPPDVYHEMVRVVASKDTPYASDADLIRDALQHRLFFWRKVSKNRALGLSESLDAWAINAVMVERLSSKVMFLDARQHTQRMVFDVVERLAQEGHTNSAMEELEMYRDVIESQYDGEDKAAAIRFVNKLRKRVQAAAAKHAADRSNNDDNDLFQQLVDERSMGGE